MACTQGAHTLGQQVSRAPWIRLGQPATPWSVDTVNISTVHPRGVFPPGPNQLSQLHRDPYRGDLPPAMRVALMACVGGLAMLTRVCASSGFLL